MNSEPAFPHSYKIPEPERPLTIGDTATVHGISMRDWFAGQAMKEWVHARIGQSVDDLDREGMARECYLDADAMLRARKEK